MIDKEEKEFSQFEALFNRDGYVLDFSNSSYDSFTAASVGIPVQKIYGGSKGRSLHAFLMDDSVESAIKWKLLSDLFEHYEEKYVAEYNPEWTEDEFISGINVYGKFNPGFSKLHTKCKGILAQHTTNNLAVTSATENLKTIAFSSQYLQNQIDLMLSEVDTNPTDAIGKAKELIESCCKTILEDNGVIVDEEWNVPKLLKETTTVLNDKILPAGVNNQLVDDAVKKLVGNLSQVGFQLATIRNKMGTGHGRSDNFKGLEPRHARLAVGASSTLCWFLWETHKAE